MPSAAIDLVPSPEEIAAIDRFRVMMLSAMDAMDVPRPGRPAGSSPQALSSPRRIA